MKKFLAFLLTVSLAHADTLLNNVKISGTTKLAGATSGTIEITPPSVSGTTVITWPGSSGTLLLTNGSGASLTGIPTLGGTNTWTAANTFSAALTGTSISLSGAITSAGVSSSADVVITNGGGFVSFGTSTFRQTGAFASVVTITGATNITWPVSGTLYGTQVGSITSAQLASSLSDETGTGAVVLANSPAIVTPTIADFTNATHNHTNAAGGGQLSLTAAVSGTLPVANGGTGQTVWGKFRAHKNGTNQTMTAGAQAQVTFGTEEFDTNNEFASNTHTISRTGYVHYSVNVTISGMIFDESAILILLDNGTEVRRWRVYAAYGSATNPTTSFGDDFAVTSGHTMTIELYMSSAVNRDIDGTAARTDWSGFYLQ